MTRVPVDDRPREKLVRAGVETLGDNELLALVIGTGTRDRGALTVALDILAVADGLPGLARIGSDDLERVAGIGAARAARVLAAVELGRRTLTRDSPGRPRFLSPDEAADYLMPRYGTFVVERLGVMLLDQKQRLIRTTVVSTGTLDATLAHPRDVFRTAVAASAASVVVFHNHPSGDPSPSAEDLRVTAELVEAGRLLDIELLDHLVIGHGRWVSLRALGAV